MPFPPVKKTLHFEIVSLTPNVESECSVVFLVWCQCPMCGKQEVCGGVAGPGQRGWRGRVTGGRRQLYSLLGGVGGRGVQLQGIGAMDGWSDQTVEGI